MAVLLARRGHRQALLGRGFRTNRTAARARIHKVGPDRGRVGGGRGQTRKAGSVRCAVMVTGLAFLATAVASLFAEATLVRYT